MLWLKARQERARVLLNGEIIEECDFTCAVMQSRVQPDESARYIVQFSQQQARAPVANYSANTALSIPLARSSCASSPRSPAV